MENLWASQSFQLESNVLRLRLRPYCCGHEINLCRIQSPFVFGGESTFSDLLTAALLCSQTFEAGREIIDRPHKAERMARWWGWLLRVGWGPEHYVKSLAAFRGYLHAGVWSPDTARQHGPGVSYRELVAPRAYRLVPFLCAHLGLNESEALNFPIARANAYYAAAAEQRGDLVLSGGSEEGALLKHLADLEERAAKGEPVWES